MFFKDLIKDGIPQDLIEASLHQLEIKLKKISGGFPYGLQLLMSSMPYILHDADIVSSYDLEASLQSLKSRINKKGYLENRIINEMFLNNSSRLTFQLVPDNDYDQKQDNKIKEYLISKQKSLSKTEIEKINKLNSAEIRQNKKDDQYTSKSDR